MRIGPLHIILAFFLTARVGQAQPPPAPAVTPSIEEKTAGMTSLAGFFTLFWDEANGKLYWEIDRWDTEFLYLISLSTGLGSNPVGLDRGQMGSSHLLTARRVGPRVLLLEPNYRFRARSGNPDEVRAVEQAFAPSIHWGFPIAARSGERVLVDATDFFLRDAHGVQTRLRDTGQGDFRLDPSRSVIDRTNTLSFPRNTEIESLLTFTSERPGPLVGATAASGEAVTLRQHHSLVELPGGGYTPRAADPRVGDLGITFYDYATPIDERLAVQWVSRHRLVKRSPRAARSEPVAPLIYYVDRGIPEPVRSAVLEGARWWSAGFEAAGFVDGFRVELLPEGAHHVDFRYNVIHWTHRSTRGWSYGGSVVDPRTGEILKGNVNLGSLRLRQNVLMATGLAPRDSPDAGRCQLAAGPSFEYLGELAQAQTGADPVAFALARIRQLTAHEVGHAIGFPHNYIASTYGRASVMDYPAPLVRIRSDGRLDLSDAYGVGIGEYDRFAAQWLYSEFPPGTDERRALESLVSDGLRRGMRFLTDQDARPEGAAHPLAALWDNGADPVSQLRHEIEVRRVGLAALSEAAVRPGEPLASLEEVLMPLYLHHRYQLEAAAHSLGGADYRFALRGDGQIPIQIVPAANQREALEAILATLSPDFLALPERILRILPARPYRWEGGEIFNRRTGATFDPLGVAASAADFAVSFILQPERLARLIEFHSRDRQYPGAEEVVDRLLALTWSAPAPSDPFLAEIEASVERVVLDQLLAQAGSERNIPQVRAILTRKLGELADGLQALSSPTAHQSLALEDIRRWQSRPEGATPRARPPALPPGMPIGGASHDRSR